jgi:hypothetical protein
MPHREGPGHYQEEVEEEEASDGVSGVGFHWDNAPVHTNHSSVL